MLFHQDYLHFNEAWIHVIQFLLREYFEPLTAIDGWGFCFPVSQGDSRRTLRAPRASETNMERILN